MNTRTSADEIEQVIYQAEQALLQLLARAEVAARLDELEQVARKNGAELKPSILVATYLLERIDTLKAESEQI